MGILDAKLTVTESVLGGGGVRTDARRAGADSGPRTPALVLLVYAALLAAVTAIGE